jgi:hypothetical protein
LDVQWFFDFYVCGILFCDPGYLSPIKEINIEQKKETALAVSFFYSINSMRLRFNNFHAIHFIALFNLIDHVYAIYHFAEACVVAVQVSGVGTRVANEEL